MQKKKTSLHTTQKLLQDWITGLPPKSSSSMVKNRPPLSAQERVQIYATAYFYRLRDCLMEDFPGTSNLLGAEIFTKMVRAYLKKIPPSHYSIRYAGQHLPDFLKKNPPGKKQPWIASLAQLEWLILEVFDGPNAILLTKEHLQSIPPSHWGALILKTIAGATLFESPWPVHEIRDKILKKKKFSPIKKQTKLIIWRKAFTPYVRPVTATEFKMMALMKKGIRFDKICRWLSKHEKNSDVTNQMAGNLMSWMEDGLLEYRMN